MAFLHPHLAAPDGNHFFTADVVDNAEFFGDERESKRRRIEHLSQRYLKGEILVIQSAKLRGPFKNIHSTIREEPRKGCETQKRVKSILKQEQKVRPVQPSSPETLAEKTPSVIKEATREWLQRLEPPAESPEAEGEFSRLQDRLDGLEYRTPSKSSHPPSIGKKPSVNHALRRNSLKMCFKEKKKAGQAQKPLASDSLLDLYDLDLSGKPAIRSNSQPTLNVIPLSLQVNVDKDSVAWESGAGNEERSKVDLAQEGQPSRLPTPEVVQETPGRAPLTSMTTAIFSSPMRKTVHISDDQENLLVIGETRKDSPDVRPQHFRKLSDPTRKKEKTKKSHNLHASPTILHSPFLYRKACGEEKPKATTTKGPKRRAATARFVEFGSSPAHVDQSKSAEITDKPQTPELGVDEDILIENAPKAEGPDNDALKDEAAKYAAAKHEAVTDQALKEEVPNEEMCDEACNDAPKEGAEHAPESLPSDFSTQAALVTAQQAFQQQLVSPAKKSDIYSLLDPDHIFASQNTIPPPGSPPTFSPITPFRHVIQEDCKSEKSPAPPVSTQELFDAATPFAFSTVKKQKLRKSVTIGIPSLLNPNTKPAGIARLLNPKNMSPTFTPTNSELLSQVKDTSPTFTPAKGKLKSQIKSNSPTFASVNGKHSSQLKDTNPTFAPVKGKPQSRPESTSWGFIPINGQPQSVRKSRWTPITSQSVSTCWTSVNVKRDVDDDTTVADSTDMFDASEVATDTPAVSPSKRRKSRKRSSPLSVRAVAPAPQPTPSALTSVLSSQLALSSTAPPTVSHLSQSQPQARDTTTPSPLLQRRHRSASPLATMSALLTTCETRPGRSTMLPELPDAQRRSVSVALLGDDEDVDVDEVVEAADSFLSSWDWRKELGSVGASQ